MSKERSNNFSREELTKLKELLEKYSVIMNKKTDHASTKQKDEAWSQLTNEFNSNNLIYRTKKQLIYKFNNMKKNARKELSQEKGTSLYWWRATTIMGESMVGLPSTHDSDFILDNTPQLNSEEAQQSGTLPNIEEMSVVESYINGHNDGVNSNVARIVLILDVQENEEIESEKAVKFDTSTPYAMLRKPVSKPLEPGNRKRKLNFTPLETRKKIFTKKSTRKREEQTLLEFAEEEHHKNMQHKDELHDLEMAFKKKLHELLLKKAATEVEIEEEKLKKLKAENHL